MASPGTLTAAVLAALAVLTPGAARGFGEPPLPATEITRVLSLQEAAARGMVTLSAKGGVSGDQVAVDLRHRPSPGPVRVTVRIEFTGFADPAGAAPNVGLAVRNGIRELNRLVVRGPGVPRIEFDVQYRVTGRGAPQTPGFHQIRVIRAAPDYRSGVDGDVTPNAVGGTTGTWSLADLFDRRTFAHETLHLAGLPDRYTTSYREPGTGRRFPAPSDLDDQRAVDAWARAHVPPLRPGGAYTSTPRPGFGCDIMASLGACARLRPYDVRTLAAQAGVRLDVEPGELLQNKRADQQDFGVAGALRLIAPRGGAARVDGLVVYCIDLDAGTPSAGTLFDAAGPASSFPGPGYAQLHRVLTHVAALPAPADGSRADLRPGAQLAVWAVTDRAFGDAPVTGDPLAVLQGAGLDPAALVAPPDVPNPNAAAAATGAVTPAGTVVPAPAEPPAPPAPRVRLERVELSQTALRAGRVNRVRLVVQVSGGTPTLRIAVQRRTGPRWVALGAFPPRRVGAGTGSLGLRFAALPAGRYRLRVTGAGAVVAPFAVR